MEARALSPQADSLGRRRTSNSHALRRGRGHTGETGRFPVLNGGGTMPAGIVKGGEEKDVLAYVATLIKPPGG